jgi:hypothetical protein
VKGPRARTGLNLSALVTGQERLPDREPDPVTMLHVRRDGCRAAAWLVRDRRAQFRRAGEVDFELPAGAEAPPWFRVAIEYLKRRPGWSVVVFRRGGANDGARSKTYRVTWMAWARIRAAREERAWGPS